MRDISENLHHSIDYNKKLNEQPNIVLSDGDSIDIPVTNDELMLKLYLLSIDDMIKSKKIIGFNETNTCSFNISFSFIDDEYTVWEKMIRLAKKYDIKFKINEKYECCAEELENYINKFVKSDRDNKKEFIFKNKGYKLEYNPITNTSNDTRPTYDSSIKTALLISEYLNEDLCNYLNDNRDSVSSITFALNKGDKFDKRKLNILKETIDNLKKDKSLPIYEMYFFSNCYYCNKEEFMNLLEFERYVRKNYKNDYELKFHSGNTIINKRQIINGNNKINEVVKYLKESSLSPYEKVVYVQKLLSEKKFFNSKSPFINQDIYTILNTRNIVCIGYAMIFNAIFDELNDENIKVRIQVFDYNISSKDKNSVLHSLNTLYVKDEKYDFEGYYDLDITASGEGLSNLSYFMLPAGDIINITRMKKWKDEENYMNGLISKKPALFIEGAPTYYKNISEKRLKNTNEFLDTPMGKEAKKYTDLVCEDEVDKVLYAVKRCVDKTKPISIVSTQKALETVAKSGGLSESESKEYAKNAILQETFNAFFIYDREKCRNEFAKYSLEIEKDNVKLIQKDKNNKR